jgi:hypothetical protein
VAHEDLQDLDALDRQVDVLARALHQAGGDLERQVADAELMRSSIQSRAVSIGIGVAIAGRKSSGSRSPAIVPEAIAGAANGLDRLDVERAVDLLT